jgi:hypothetical protein
MLIAGGGVERVLGPQLQKIYKTNSTPRTRLAAGQDAVTISSQARLVQKGADAASSLPDVRADAVAKAISRVNSGQSVSSTTLASAMAQRASERMV